MKETKSSIRLSFSPDGSGYRVKAYSGKMESKKIQGLYVAGEVLDGLLAHGILGGFDLSGDYPELGHALLVCATETRDEADLQRYAEALAEVV